MPQNHKDNIITLAIESSCDETSAAVFLNNKPLSNLIATQEVHKSYGGVVPELASRAHQQQIIPVIQQSLQQAAIELSQVDVIAYTLGPGLMGALMVGSSVAKSLSIALQKPLVEVNHMQAHVLAHFILDKPQKKLPGFPFLCLTVSGGHTQLVLLKSHLDSTILGETIDDAAGEAFDKCAKILGLPYPGGPLIDKYAQEGNEHAFSFTESNLPGYNFTFSGIKTAFLYFIQKQVALNKNFIDENRADLCASIQKCIVAMLLKKFKDCIVQNSIKHIGIAGGVSANSYLRKKVVGLAHELNVEVYIPNFEYCTDNAAMIAITGYYKFLEKDFGKLTTIPQPRLV